MTASLVLTAKEFACDFTEQSWALKAGLFVTASLVLTAKEFACDFTEQSCALKAELSVTASLVLTAKELVCDFTEQSWALNLKAGLFVTASLVLTDSERVNGSSVQVTSQVPGGECRCFRVSAGNQALPQVQQLVPRSDLPWLRQRE